MTIAAYLPARVPSRGAIEINTIRNESLNRVPFLHLACERTLGKV